MGHQPMAINLEFIALGFSPENWMIIKDQAFANFPRLPHEEESRRQSTDSAADDNAIIYLTRIDRRCGKRLKLAVANSVARFHNFVSIAIRSPVIADSSVTRPIVRREKFQGSR